ncbi:MAG: FtsX-like permease family protein [Candidatus Kapaibacterium sp.]
MRLIWLVALRQLMARKRQAVAIIAGVVIGVTVLLVTISLFGGLLDSFTAKILDVAPHVTMTAEKAAGAEGDVLVEGENNAPAAVQLDKNMEQEERTRLRNVMPVLRVVERALGERLTAASPFLSTQALAAYGTNDITLQVNGVIPRRAAKINDLAKYLKSGSIDRLEASRGGMLIGAKAAADLGVDYGDRIRLVSLSGQVFNVQIVGVYRLGVEAADKSGIVNLRLAQALDRALPGDATGIDFQLADVTEAPAVATMIERLTGRKTDTWQQTNAGILTVFRFLQILFYVVVGFVIVICGFGVANILITSVMEKRRDIAVMKSFGFSAGSLTSIYLIQGMVIALIGSAIGCGVGAIAIKFVGMIPSGGTGGVAPVETATLQMGWSPWYFVVAVAGTLLVSIIAAVAPARSAARVIPVEILRGEQ